MPLSSSAALGLEGAEDDGLRVLEEEVKDLRDVWSALLPPWDALQVRGYSPKDYLTYDYLTHSR